MFNNIFKDKKILITGDTGFKGSWLAIWLIHLGAKVYGYSLPPKTPKDNYVITNLKDRIFHYDGDIRNFKQLFSFFNEVQPDFCFHLAAQPLVLESYKEPLYNFETNVLGTVNFLECLRQSKNRSIGLIITSDKCYKNNEWIWGYREDDQMGGDDPYSASKGACEIIFNSYLKSFFLEKSIVNVASVRAGNVIGGGDWAENRIVPDFFRALEKKVSLFIRNPNHTRPWQFVLEPLSGYLHLAERLYSQGKKFQGAWNFGPYFSSNKDVKTLVNELCKYSDGAVYELNNEINTLKESSLLNLDISKAMYYLNWRPVLTFEQSIKMTVDGYLLNYETDCFNQRIEQIDTYCKIAKENNIIWTK